MFVRNGYEATTMRSIADRIEYTPTAIYHHFRNKEALLSELCASDFRALAQAFHQIERVEDPIERLGRIGEAYVSFAVEHPMQYMFMFMTRRPALSRAEIGLNRGDPSEDAYAFLRDVCAEAIASGLLRPEYEDPDEVAQMLWAGVHGIVAIRIAKEHDEWIEFRDTKQTALRLRQALLRGLTKRSDA